jgi:ABC-type multidrug transport system fused ATPase/permease subunit
MKLSYAAYWRLFARYVKPVWLGLVLLALLLAANIGLQLLNPWIARAFIDGARAEVPLESLTLTALAFLAVAILIQVASVAEGYVAENVGWLATNALRLDLVEHCLELDLGFHQTHPPGELIERVDGDVSALSNFFTSFVLRILGNMVLLLGILVLLFREEWRLGLVLGVFSLTALLLMIRTRSVAARYVAARRGASAEVFAALEEQLGGLSDIQANGARDFILERWQNRLRALVESASKATLIGGLVTDPGILLLGVGSIAAFALAALFYQSGELTLGTVYLVFQYTAMLRAPIEQINRQARDLQTATASIGRIAWLAESPRAINDGPGATFPDGPLTVEFRDVSFSYDSAERALTSVSFQLPPGRVLGVVGRTGAGKSTLMRLLARLYDPTDGEVRVGSVDLRQARSSDLRAHIGIVTQDVQVFRATVRDNLALFDPTIPDPAIARALDYLELGDWLRSLPRGLDSEISPTQISAGEAQLLAFARVFLQDPGLIVLDEASSRLDPATERRIERGIQRLFEGRTAIVIAHRLDTLRDVDDILMLENGSVEELDRRDRLAADPTSHFARLLRVGGAEVLA